MDAWWTNFKTYLAESKNLSDWRSILKSFGKTETEIKSPFEAPESDKKSGNRNSFEFLLSQFLFSRHGSKFKRNFRFDGNLTCNQPAPPIKVKYDRFKKIVWIRSHHIHLQWKFKLLAGEFTQGNEAKHCWVMSTNLLF